MSAAAFIGDYVDLRFVKGRKVCQVVVELPIERGAEFVAAFGTPNPEASIPVALARLNPEAMQQNAEADEPNPIEQTKAPPHRSWGDLQASQQAGIRCSEPAFQRFMLERHGFNDAAIGVRTICGVTSRSVLNINDQARWKWHRLAEEFVLWTRYPEAA